MRVPATAQITRIGTAAGLSEPDRTSMRNGGDPPAHEDDGGQAGGRQGRRAP